MSHIAEVDALGYNGSVHKHLRRLERIWIDSPIYFVTTCTRHRKQLLVHTDVAKILIGELRAAHDRHGWAVGRYVIMPDDVHFFCRPELDAKPLSEFIEFWKSYTSRRSTRLDSRGQRPRLQRCGNANFLIMHCGRQRVIRKSGITSGIILCGQVWFRKRTNGNTPV